MPSYERDELGRVSAGGRCGSTSRPSRAAPPYRNHHRKGGTPHTEGAAPYMIVEFERRIQVHAERVARELGEIEAAQPGRGSRAGGKRSGANETFRMTFGDVEVSFFRRNGGWRWRILQGYKAGSFGPYPSRQEAVRAAQRDLAD